MSDVAPVVHVVSAGEVGGAERMLVDLATARREDALARRHSIALFTPNDRLRALFVDAGIPVDDRGRVREGPASFLASTLGPRDVRWLAHVLEQRGARIVHLHTFASQVLGTRAAARVGACVVRTEHSTRVYDDPSCWPFSRWSLRRAHAVVCISEHVHDVAVRRAPFLVGKDATAQLEVVRNGVDTERFTPRASPPTTDTHGLVRFVALGRLDRRKGLDLALECLAGVPGATLEIVGDGEEREALERLASTLGVRDRVRFSGYAADVRDAIARADVALSSARAEGLGVALLEAMAMGRPVVGVPIGGVPEIVRDGATGWLAGERSLAGLSRVMRAAVDAPEERVRRGAAARREIVARFSLATMRAGYEQIYQHFDRCTLVTRS